MNSRYSWDRGAVSKMAWCYVLSLPKPAKAATSLRGDTWHAPCRSYPSLHCLLELWQTFFPLASHLSHTGHFDNLTLLPLLCVLESHCAQTSNELTLNREWKQGCSMKVSLAWQGLSCKPYLMLVTHSTLMYS